MALLAVRRPRVNTVRPGFVYGYRVRHPDTGQIVIGYVGQTRWPDARDEQHRETQPWADTIVGAMFIIDEGNWTDLVLDARELEQIAGLRPLYNIVGNRRNPHRIKPWVAQRQRHQRDRAAGRPLWHPVKVSRRRPLPGRREPRQQPHAPRAEINWGWIVPVELWIVGTAGLGWLTREWVASVAATGVAAAGVGAWLVFRRRRR